MGVTSRLSTSITSHLSLTFYQVERFSNRSSTGEVLRKQITADRLQLAAEISECERLSEVSPRP
jgi:hypothetical protein